MAGELQKGEKETNSGGARDEGKEEVGGRRKPERKKKEGKIPYKNTYGVCIVFNFLCSIIITGCSNLDSFNCDDI